MCPCLQGGWPVLYSQGLANFYSHRRWAVYFIDSKRSQHFKSALDKPIDWEPLCFKDPGSIPGFLNGRTQYCQHFGMMILSGGGLSSALKSDKHPRLSSSLQSWQPQMSTDCPRGQNQPRWRATHLNFLGWNLEFITWGTLDKLLSVPRFPHP